MSDAERVFPPLALAPTRRAPLRPRRDDGRSAERRVARPPPASRRRRSRPSGAASRPLLHLAGLLERPEARTRSSIAGVPHRR